MLKHLITEDNYSPVVDTRLISTLYFRHIYKRVHDMKFNFLGMIVGKHRVGKSLGALSYSYMLDPSFAENIRKRVVYYADDFMKALKSIREKKIIGGAIVWDEAGVGIPAREWYNISNKSINMALQVFGRYRPIVFFVTQDVTYIDSQARKLFHGFYQMERFNQKYATASPFNVRYDKKTGKVYYVYSRFYMKNEEFPGGKFKFNELLVKKPPSDFEKEYDIHSKEFKDRIMEQMQERAEAHKDGNLDSKKMSSSEIVKDLIESHVDDLKYLSKRSKPDDVLFDEYAIRHFYNVPARVARFIKKNAEIEANKRNLIEDEDDSNS